MIHIIKEIYTLSGEKKKDLVISSLFQFLQAVCEGGTYAVLMWILTSLLYSTYSLKILLMQCTTLTCIMILRYIFELSSNKLQQTCGYEIMGLLRLQEAEKLRTLPMGSFTGENIGKMTSIFTNNISFVEMYCMAPITRFVAAFFTTFVTSFIMLVVNVPMALVSMMGFLPAFLVYKNAQKKLEKTAQARMQSQNKLVGAVLSYLSGMEVIKAFHLTEGKNEDLMRKLSNNRDISRQYELSALTPLTIYQLLIRLGMGSIYLFGIYFLIQGYIGIPVYLFFAIISMKYYQPIETVFKDYAVVNLIKSGLSQIEQLHGEEPFYTLSKKTIENTSISFEQVDFSYDKNQTLALKNCNFNIKPNSFNALVGASGSGKSTALYLIARFWDVHSGAVNISKNNIKDISYSDVLKNISMVFQDVYLFSGTVAENISMGKESATLEEIQLAAKAACCHEFIMSLPQGYDSWISEGGNTLSGGEKQRISIARAILKDAPIVLLDEALSSIDSQNAMEIQRAIDAMTSNKTVIMIAHTLAYIQTADNILVMNEGEIVAHGKHEKLLEESPHYQSMWNNEKISKSWSIKS